MSSARELYVYYRVDSTQVDPTRRAIEALQRALIDAHPGLSARLLQKEPVADEAPTWMEIYTAPGGVSPPLAAAIEEAAMAVAHLLRGARHVEVFLAGDR
ncbi:MAG: hypothetical protein JWQ11_3844 [Rhizobacter sp.]|nr:hypothetical protein [Rhizobacter sp.]